MLDASPQFPQTPETAPIINSPRVVLVLIGLCTAIQAVLAWAGEDIRLWAIMVFGFIPAQVTGNWQESLPFAREWSFLSYALLHGSWLHLMFNCLWMLVFGSVVARRLGTVRFLLLSAGSAVTAAVATLVVHWNEAFPLIGASGAISGQMAAAVPLMYGSGLRAGLALRTDLSHVRPLSPLELAASRGAVFFIVVWLGITLLTGAVGTGVGEDVRIAWEAHIGGFLGGLALFYGLDRNR